jgi:exopolysaccharide biosynthesis polyprenyl glycosylphosphotransferase
MEFSESMIDEALQRETDEIVLPREEIDAPHVVDSAPSARNVRPVVRHRPGDSRRLRHRIVFIDVVAALFSWTTASLTFRWFHRGEIAQSFALFIIGAFAFSALVVALCFVFQMYRTKVSFVPADERLRIFAVSLVASIAAGTTARVETHQFSLVLAIAAFVAFFMSDLIVRAMFRQWLRIQRTHGRFHREILLIGTNDDALAMYDLLRTHPEIGFSIIGVIGDKTQAENFDDIAWCGTVDEVIEAVRKTGATGVVISANAMAPSQLRKTTNRLVSRSIHVHVSSGLFGFDERRLRAQSFSREPVYYVEPLTFPLIQRAIKRTIDIIVSLFGLIIAAPIIAIAALFIKLHDRGPVFFHQTRIGKDSRPFRCIKLRTMTVDAEKHLDKLMKNNERHGPLFKQKSDPRRTPVGRILEATSIDEIPQLWLVLRGVMSLIGPRPALPHEVALFDEELNERHIVRPGITGLWQVEGRDNPSFDAYRRLDLFYVENWSLFLDLSILAMTANVVFSRAINMFLKFHRPDWARAGVGDPGEARDE